VKFWVFSSEIQLLNIFDVQNLSTMQATLKISGKDMVDSKYFMDFTSLLNAPYYTINKTLAIPCKSKLLTLKDLTENLIENDFHFL
jgi:hypothetical protein